MKKRILLIGSAGTGTAFASICGIRKHWLNEVVIHAMDINAEHLVSSALFCDKFHQCPLSSSPDFFPYLIDTIKEQKVDIYLPLLPREITLAQRELNTLKQLNVDVILASRNFEIDVSDKWHVFLHATKFEIPSPKTFLSVSQDLGDRFFVKPRFGFGSQGSFQAQKDDVKNLSTLENGQYVFQELCERPEFTIDAFYAPEHNFIYTVARERIEVKAGVCVKARIFIEPSFNSLAEKIASAFSIAGSFCFQIMNLQGAWVLTDLNPRPGAGTAMSVACGADFLSANFAYACNLDFFDFFQEISGDVFVTRQYCEFVHRSSK